MSFTSVYCTSPIRQRSQTSSNGRSPFRTACASHELSSKAANKDSHDTIMEGKALKDLNVKDKINIANLICLLLKYVHKLKQLSRELDRIKHTSTIIQRENKELLEAYTHQLYLLQSYQDKIVALEQENRRLRAGTAKHKEEEGEGREALQDLMDLLAGLH